MSKYKYLLFDADGTLLDFTGAEKFSFFHTLKQYEINATTEMFERYKVINKKLWTDLEQGIIKKSELVIKRFADFFAEFGIDRNQMDFNADYLANLAMKSFLIDNAYEVLEKLSKEYTIIIVTNGVAVTQYKRLDTSTLMPFINEVIVSEDAGFLKPDKGFFEYTFEKCNINISEKSKAIVIGDSLSADMKGAENFELTSCWHNPDKIINDKNIKIDYEIRDLRELYDIVLGK